MSEAINCCRIYPNIVFTGCTQKLFESEKKNTVTYTKLGALPQINARSQSIESRQNKPTNHHLQSYAISQRFFVAIFFQKQWNYFTIQAELISLGWKILEICLIYYKKYAHFLVSLSNHRLTIIFTEIYTSFFSSSFRTFFRGSGRFQCVFHLVFWLLEYIKWRMTKTNLEMSIDSLLSCGCICWKAMPLTRSHQSIPCSPLCVSQLFRFRANAAASERSLCVCVCWVARVCLWLWKQESRCCIEIVCTIYF